MPKQTQVVVVTEPPLRLTTDMILPLVLGRVIKHNGKYYQFSQDSNGSLVLYLVDNVYIKNKHRL